MIVTVPRAYNSRMDVGVAAARVIRSRHRIAACRDMLDRVAKLLNAADDRTLRRREATPATIAPPASSRNAGSSARPAPTFTSFTAALTGSASACIRSYLTNVPVGDGL